MADARNFVYVRITYQEVSDIYSFFIIHHPSRNTASHIVGFYHQWIALHFKDKDS